MLPWLSGFPGAACTVISLKAAACRKPEDPRLAALMLAARQDRLYGRAGTGSQKPWSRGRKKTLCMTRHRMTAMPGRTSRTGRTGRKVLMPWKKTGPQKPQLHLLRILACTKRLISMMRQYRVKPFMKNPLMTGVSIRGRAGRSLRLTLAAGKRQPLQG